MRGGFFSALGVALLALLALAIWKLSFAVLAICTPFVVALGLALLLDPLVDRLEERGMRRWMGVGLVFSILLVVVGLIGYYGVPALVGQTKQLADNGPRYLADLKAYSDNFLEHHHKILGMKMPANFNAVSKDLTDRATTLLGTSTGRASSFLLGSITTLFEIVISLIVTFYLLLDIDRFRARMFYLAPKPARAPMRIIFKDIGNVFSEYLRGMLIVSALYGVGTLALLLILSIFKHDLFQYALLIGVAGGLLYTIPYLGPLVTAVITFLVAFAAGGIEFGGIAVLLTLFLNQLFDNVITPRVVGGGVGLHPIASLFALTLGGTLFGVWGMLLSVPVAASVQVILFRLFPILTTPTPGGFLRAQGVPPDEEESAKVMEGDAPKLPEGEGPTLPSPE